MLAQRVGELRGNAQRSEPGLTERLRDDLRLEPRRDLVGHARRSALAWSQDHQPVAQHERPPVVIGRAVEAELATRSAHPDLFSAREKLQPIDRKSTRLNSSHSQISYAVFCLKKKKYPRLCTRRPRTPRLIRSYCPYAKSN